MIRFCVVGVLLLATLGCSAVPGGRAARRELTELNEKDFAAIEILDAYIGITGVFVGAVDATASAAELERMRVTNIAALKMALQRKETIVAILDGRVIMLVYKESVAIPQDIARAHGTTSREVSVFSLWTSTPDEEQLPSQRSVSGEQIRQSILASPYNQGPTGPLELANVFFRAILGLE